MCVVRDQCEELRGILSKRHQDEVCQERAEQLRLKAEEKRIKEQGSTSVRHIHTKF